MLFLNNKEIEFILTHIFPKIDKFNEIQNSYHKVYIKIIRKDYTPQKLKLFNNKKENLISEFGLVK